MSGKLVTLTWRHDPVIYAPAKYRKACKYRAFIPDPILGETFDVDAQLAGILSEAERAIGELNASAHPALAPLARLLLRTESIASSKVEGMSMGARDLARAEVRSETTGKARPLSDEILANIDAMELAVSEAAASETFGIPQIAAIHDLLMAKAHPARQAGELRTVQNWIGGNDHNPCGADFVPPPPEHVVPLLEDLCAAINDDVLPPLLQAAQVHAQFETIHPFDDGNGRTGRALVHVVLKRRNIAHAYVPPISVVLASPRDKYIQGLTQFRTGEIGDWVEYFATAAATAARLATAYLQAVTDLTEHWRDQLRKGRAPRADAAAWAIIDVLPAYPILTLPVAVAATGRAKSMVNQAIAVLEDAGVLIPLSVGARRNRSWEAAGLLELIEDLEAGRAPQLSV